MRSRWALDFKDYPFGLFNNFSSPIQTKTIRYGTPMMSNPVGSHHALFNQGNGLMKQPAAPRHPPASEIVAAGFLLLIHEQTVILLKAITPAARTNSRPAMDQRKSVPISMRERPNLDFLSRKSDQACFVGCWKNSAVSL